MATGHAGLGTLHAENLSAVVDRLVTKPINLPKAMLENLDLIVFLTSTKKGNSYIRRVQEVVEIVGYDYNKGDLVSNVPFKWDPSTDTFEMLNSVLLEKIKTKLSYSLEQLRYDLERRAKLLNWLKENNISDYKEFVKYISLYYTDPERAMSLVS
jgi:flagellar protein FlaI